MSKLTRANYDIRIVFNEQGSLRDFAGDLGGELGDTVEGRHGEKMR